MTRKQLCKFLLVLLFMGFPLSVAAGDTYDEHELKAAITYNVVKFVKWPDGTFAGAKEPLVICVMGNGATASGFASLDGRLLGKRPIKVQYWNSYDSCQDGHVLYLSRFSGHHLDEVLISLQQAPVLTVSDLESFASRGGMINLVKIKKNIRFAINLNASMAAKLKISSKLHPLATEVIRSGG